MVDQYSGNWIECFFQEPLYTEADKNYLRGLGHSVIEAPAALQMITSTTLVFAVHLPMRQYLRCLDCALPAMLVGTTFSVYDGYVGCVDFTAFLWKTADRMLYQASSVL